MLFYGKHFVRAVLAVLGQRLRRGGAHHPRRPLPVDILTVFLRRTLHQGLVDGPRKFRQREYPTPLKPGLARRVELTRVELAGLDTLRAVPRRPTSGRLLYLHGGGYTFCSTTTHRGLVANLAATCGVECLAPDYRLAPEHRHPAAVDDAVAVYRALLGGDQGGETLSPSGDQGGETLWIGGDSAGGGLALATLLRLREAGDPLPRAAVLLSPWVDLTCKGESTIANAPYDYLSQPLLRFFADCYLGDLPPTTPLASPLYADLTGLPPLLIQVGGAETLATEGRALEARARTAGVETELQVWDGAFHAFQIFSPIVPEADRAVRAIADFLREHKSTPRGA